MRVLLVEDEAAHAELISAQLGSAFRSVLTVEHFTNLADALEGAERSDFDVALVDLNLPDSRGVATVERFCARYAELPIVVLTSLDDEASSSRALRCGAQDYLAKDQLSPEAIRRSVRHALELKRIVVRLQRANRDLTHFAHTVAHEIRSPLTTLSFTAALLDEVEDLDVVSRHTVRIRNAVAEVDNVLAGVLEFAANDADEGFEMVVLRELVEEVLANLDSEIQEAGARVELSETLPTVACVPVRLRMVFRNLIANGLRYRHPDRPPIVRIDARRRADVWEVTVEDNGSGMSEADRRIAFEMFQRGSGHTDHTGRGIGLALCQRIVEAHSGRIWIRSELDVGTSVHLTLPIDA